jgi:hypothetical protein
MFVTTSGRSGARMKKIQTYKDFIYGRVLFFSTVTIFNAGCIKSARVLICSLQHRFGINLSVDILGNFLERTFLFPHISDHFLDWILCISPTIR